MRRNFLRSKIHRCNVTMADLNYAGSLTVDLDLLDAADMHPFERVEVYDITNGNRFATYLMAGPRGSGIICVNGAAAHLAKPKDLIIAATYVDLEPDEIRAHRPIVVLVDEKNRLTERLVYDPSAPPEMPR